MQNYRFTSFTLILILGLIWGTGYSIARFATTNGITPLGYSFWQSLGPALLITLFCYTSKSPLKFSAVHLRYYFICGLIGIVIPNTNMYFAAPHLPAGLLAVIVNTVPIISYILALSFKVEEFNIVRFFGMCSAIMGILIIILPAASLPSPEMIPWVLSALITPLSFAACAIYISRHRPTVGNSMSLAAGTLIASSILLAPMVLLSGNFYTFRLPFTPADHVILLEIVLSSIGYILLFKLIKVAGAVYYSLVDTIVALTGLSWGYILFHETLNHWLVLAVGFILLALVLVTKNQRAIIKYPSMQTK